MYTEFDVAGTYNTRAINTQKSEPGSGYFLLRSATLDNLTAVGVAKLRQLGVDQILDLREPTEREAAGSAEQKIVSFAPAHDIPTVSVPLYGTQPPQLGNIVDIYLHLLTQRGNAIAAAVAVLAEHPGTTLVHCTAGKDRTGLVVALAQLAAGVDPHAIIADYVRSGKNVRPQRETVVTKTLSKQRLSGTAYTEALQLHLDSPASAMQSVFEHISTISGGQRCLQSNAADYLLRHGLSIQALTALKQKLKGHITHSHCERSDVNSGSDRLDSQLAKNGHTSCDNLTIVHLSDIHASNTGQLYDTADGLSHFDAVIDYLQNRMTKLDAIVITGDLIERGNYAAYDRVEDACQRLSDTLRMPVITVYGNHDSPKHATTLAPERREPYSVIELKGFRLVRLNSADGSLGEQQMRWLANTLEQDPEKQTILALHHPPTISPVPHLQNQTLLDTAELLHITAKYPVRAILAGHYHHHLSATVAQTTVFVGAPLAYHLNTLKAPGIVAGYRSAWLSIANFTATDVSYTPIHLTPSTELFQKDLNESQQHASSADIAGSTPESTPAQTTNIEGK